MRERSAVALQKMETAMVAQLCPHSRASEAASLPASCEACWLCCTLSPGFNHHRKSSEPLTPAPVHSTHGQRRTGLLTSLNPSPFINKKTKWDVWHILSLVPILRCQLKHGSRKGPATKCLLSSFRVSADSLFPPKPQNI